MAKTVKKKVTEKFLGTGLCCPECGKELLEEYTKLRCDNGCSIPSEEDAIKDKYPDWKKYKK